ncbi:MAG: VOC family protein [Actinobacteria bacterium]|nr:VOC family protein [Actinomycetota bacterium]
MVDSVDLDHVALATPDARDAIRYLVGELSGIVLMGGHNLGFRPMQVRLGDEREGMTVELLEPFEPERNDFLARFLARHGAGPHHLTFKVPDLERMLQRVVAAGYQPINVNLDDPYWKEAFLHPRDAHGTVVQLAEAHEELPDIAGLVANVRVDGPHADPQWWPDPPPAGARAARLRRVVLATHAAASARAFFTGLLDGRVDGEGEGWLEFVWPTGARVRVEERAREPEGVDRLEGDVIGEPIDVRVAGARLVLSSRESSAA